MPKRQPTPTHAEAAWLRRIALPPLMATFSPGSKPEYTLQDGTGVPQKIAERLIKNGWLLAQRDGLFDLTQSYRRARTPQTATTTDERQGEFGV